MGARTFLSAFFNRGLEYPRSFHAKTCRNHLRSPHRTEGYATLCILVAKSPPAELTAHGLELTTIVEQDESLIRCEATLMSEEILIDANPAPSLVSATHLIYALHALSLLIGITTAASIIGAFVFGIPSIIAVIVNYLKRAEARGTFLESHFRWQIRTFWFGLLWCLIGGFLFVTFIGIPLAIVIFVAAGLWVIYRVVRGWLALRDRKPMYINS